jgi:hypothetical protein
VEAETPTDWYTRTSVTASSICPGGVVLGFAGSGDLESQNWELVGSGHRSGGMYLSGEAEWLRTLIVGSVTHDPRDEDMSVNRSQTKTCVPGAGSCLSSSLEQNDLGALMLPLNLALESKKSLVLLGHLQR